MYQTDGRVMVAAPLPGLEPEDISVTITGDTVVIRGQLRGPRQDERDLLMAEWSVGPYARELRLPDPVDGARANATYGNGVLVLAMPRLDDGQEGEAADFRLEVRHAPHGERVGHAGRDRHATTTAEHRQRLAQHAQSAAQGRPA
jgi:HSP20 family protein